MFYLYYMSINVSIAAKQINRLHAKMMQNIYEKSG